MGSLENLYKKECEELESIYSSKFSELENVSRQMEEALNSKHQKEMEKLYERLDEKLPKVVKYSKKYLDLKNQELNLAKQQKYKDAMLVKKKCEEIEVEDTDRFNKEKTEKIKSQSIKTANKHLNEKNALKKKIELEYEEMKKNLLKILFVGLLTVGFTGLALPGALSSEDPMGEGRSRAERLGGLAGNTVGGLAGGTLGTSLAKKFTSAVGPRAGIAGKVLGALPTIGGVLGGFAGMSGGETLGGLPFRPFRSTPQPQQPVQPMPQQMPGV